MVPHNIIVIILAGNGLVIVHVAVMVINVKRRVLPLPQRRRRATMMEMIFAILSIPFVPMTVKTLALLVKHIMKNQFIVILGWDVLYVMMNSTSLLRYNVGRVVALRYLLAVSHMLVIIWVISIVRFLFLVVQREWVNVIIVVVLIVAGVEEWRHPLVQHQPG